MPGYLAYLKNQSAAGAPGFISDQMKGIPAPPIEKSLPEEAILVDLAQPPDIKFPLIPLFDAIQKRRTHRLFSDTPISLEELSLLLWCTQGIQHLVRGGTITLRTVPSAGGMHPFETYLLINRVQDLEPGMYRYTALQHKIIKIAENNGLNEQLIQACNNQDYVANGALVFLWAARPYRSEWRNAENALKDILISAGHICQNLYLAGAGIQVGVSPIITYQQDLIDKLVGLDGETELIVYLATTGKIDTSVIQL